ncbi:hypothetical protein SUGI_0604560 [Cryptomeria japonica]|nr:hypothetical protein SUGI_0604560 [Cryptomeria japonica]
MKIKKFMEEQEEENGGQEEDEDFITMNFSAQSLDHSSWTSESRKIPLLFESPDHSRWRSGFLSSTPCSPRPRFLRYGKNYPKFSIHKLHPVVNIQRLEEVSRGKEETEAKAYQGYNGEKSQVIEEYVNESHSPQLAQYPPSLEDQRSEITTQESKQPQEPDDTT